MKEETLLSGNETRIGTVQMSKSAEVAITTVLSFLIIIDIVGNSLVCAIIKNNRDMRIRVNYLLVNLAVADIIYATFIAPRIYYKLPFSHPDGVIGPILCKFLTDGNIAWIGSGSSFVTLAAIAIERYYAVLYPLGDKGKLTQRKLKVVIAASWVFGLILNLPLFLVEDIVKEKEISGKSCSTVWPEKWMGTAYTMTWSVLVLLLLLVITALYFKVVYTLWFKRIDHSQLIHQQENVLRVRKRVTLMVVTITAIFGVCWGTNSVVYVLNIAKTYNIGPALLAIVDTMVLFNSAVNPFVYALLNQQFREKMKKMICCSGSTPPRARPTRPSYYRQLAIRTTHPTHTMTGSCCTEC